MKKFLVMLWNGMVSYMRRNNLAGMNPRVIIERYKDDTNRLRSSGLDDVGLGELLVGSLREYARTVMSSHTDCRNTGCEVWDFGSDILKNLDPVIEKWIENKQ